MTIDDVLPTWDWRSAHAARVAASPERAAAAVREFSGRDLPVTGALMRVRALGRRTFDERPTIETMARIGLAVLADEPHGILLGGVLSPWRVRGGHRPIALGRGARRLRRAGLGARRGGVHRRARRRRLARAEQRRGSPPPTTRRAGASGATGA